MKKMNLTWMLLTMGFAFLGCVRPGAPFPSRTLSPDECVASVKESGYFRHFADSNDNARLLLDDIGTEFVVFAIGEDHPEHFVRIGTVRVNRTTGEVTRLLATPAGDDYWETVQANAR